MDKKAKKKVQALRSRIATLRQRLVGAKLQPDEPGEVDEIQAEIAATEAEIAKLTASE